MKVFFIGLLLSTWAYTGCFAQSYYDATLIPKELLSYAHSVVRYSDRTIEVKDIDGYILHVKMAVTILNKNGDHNAQLALNYDKTSAVKSIKGNLYDANGKLTGKISEKDFTDASAASNSALFEDSRVKRYQPAIINYPYTVEYEYELRQKQTLFFYDWEPNLGTGVAVEKSTFTFTSKPDFKIRYKEINVPKAVVVSVNSQGLQTYQWQISGLKALKNEPYSPDYYLTQVKITPEKFTYDGVSGSFKNWDELGKWTYDKLLAGRDNLPSATVSAIKQLTAGITDPKLKAKKVYEYMQQKTRYISIQVGIGGFQPFPATEVDATGYGDCKALVNYTHALLKAVDIESWYCVVKSGARKESFLTDFASMDQGDHVILCLPFKNDTTWLECTSQKMPFGYLGNFTDDRLVLACTPSGGKLLHTPAYDESTITRRTGDFMIDNTGNLTGTMSTTYAGADYEDRDGLIDEPYSEQIKSVREIYPISNFEIDKLIYIQNKSANPVTTETIKFNSRDFAALNSGKYYFKINMANRGHYVPDEARNRQNDVYINRGYTEADEVSYQLPEDYRPDKILLDKTIDKPFGKFKASIHREGKKLLYSRYFRLNKGIYNKDLYQDLVDFYQNVADADAYTMALVKGN